MPDLRGRVEAAVSAGECEGMTRTRHDTSPQAQAIRAAGYVRVPGGLWATQEQLDLIMFMLKPNLEIINRIKDRYDNERWTKDDHEGNA